jgi:hypothetical protein
MAMTAFAPAITRSRELLANKKAEVVLKLVPELTADKQESRKYFAKFVSALGVLTLLFLLFINTLLAQDAFTLSHLRTEAKQVSDEREAIARKIDGLSSPEKLAQAAIDLGMKPATSSTYLTINNTSTAPEMIKHG